MKPIDYQWYAYSVDYFVSHCVAFGSGAFDRVRLSPIDLRHYLNGLVLSFVFGFGFSLDEADIMAGLDPREFVWLTVRVRDDQALESDQGRELQRFVSEVEVRQAGDQRWIMIRVDKANLPPAWNSIPSLAKRVDARIRATRTP